MSPFLLTIILLAAATLSVRLLSSFIKTGKAKKEKLFLRLSKEGSANNLVFCSQEILHNKVIGIDGIHRKVMILEEKNHQYNCSVISLDEVQNCELKNNYESLNEVNYRRFMPKTLHSVELQFKFKSNIQPASIAFYDSVVNSRREIVLLKAKAEYWSVMLSKMLTGKQIKARA